MPRRYDLFIKDIISSICKIREYIEDMSLDDFSQDQKTVDAVLRNLEIIGEAASKIPDEIIKQEADIPWKQVKNFRNIVAHKYWEIDFDMVWEIITDELKPLKEACERLLN